jgi:hypothetical protein
MKDGPRVRDRILAIVLWMMSAALALWVILQLRALLLNDLPIHVFQVNPWALGAIDKFGTVVLGLAWLIFVMASEPYFHLLFEQKRLVKGLVHLFLAEIGLLAVVYLARLLI